MQHIKSIIVSSIITLFSLSFISCGKMDNSDSHAAGEDNTSAEMCTGDSHAAGEDNTSPEMDSLELILKKMHSQTKNKLFNAAEINIDDKDAAKKLTNLTVLNLSNNNIGSEGEKHLAPVREKLTNLKDLYL